MNIIYLSWIVILQCTQKWEVSALRYPEPQVYVVTPSPKPLQIHEGRSAPFYYHNWMRRADIPMNSTTSPTITEKTKTPDLIFAEFESDSMRNIRKLLEKERADVKMTTTTTTTTTTMKPISVPAEEESQNVKYGVRIPFSAQDEKKDMTDYFALYNNMYNNHDFLPGPIYLPSTLPPTAKTLSTTTPATITTTAKLVNNIEDVWHIIDSQKHDQWIDILPKNKSNSGEGDIHNTPEEEDINIDENFALPGFGKNPSNGGENESRAIRTEPSIRFPYINLKPFKMKNVKQPQINNVIDNKKGNDMLTNLNNFYELKNPVRGESQDVIAPTMHQQIDRYNPAQPYLPHDYVSKQSSASSTPMKAVANLVPPPPPPPPKITDDDFPAPITYDSFPPFAPTDSDASPLSPPFRQSPVSKPIDTIYSEPDDSESPIFNGAPPKDMGYIYKPQSPPVQSFVPTLPPLTKPFTGYSNDKPIITYNPPMEDKPQNSDYHYNKPKPTDSEFSGYHYDKPISATSGGYHYDKPMSETPNGYHHNKPSTDFGGYHYNKPSSKPMDHPPAHHSYDHHESSSYSHDLPETVYENPHGGHGSDHGGHIKGNDDDMGMEPPRIEAPDTKHAYDLPPADDSGFPHDFPGELDFHHDHDNHDHDVYHYHHSSTTEMPRVNRYSYYYLGKKLYYLPLYFSVYFIVYVGALIIKAVLRHKIVYPNSWRPNDQTATFFTKRSVDSWDLSKNKLHEITGKVTEYIATAAEKYMENKKKK